MRERTVPSGFESLEQHDRITELHHRFVQRSNCYPIGREVEISNICECCGINAHRYGPGFNIQTSRSIFKDPSDIGMEHEFTIKDKESGHLQFLWREGNWHEPEDDGDNE